MWIRQSRCHEELESLCVCDGLVTELDNVAGTILDLLLAEHWFQSGVEVDADVLQQDPLAELDAKLQRSQEILLAELAHIDPCFGVLAHVLDVLVGLSLRVDHQGPAPGTVDDDTVFDGELVVRQGADHPLLDLYWIPEHGRHAASFGVSHFQLRQLLSPEFLAVASDLRGKGSSVGDHASSHDAITRQESQLCVEVLNILSPSCFLSAEATNQLVRSLQLHLAEIHVILELLLLLHGSIEIGLQGGDFVLHLS
mmetsp:Transcript_51844/g.121546  ORF Transcript_51844/g.121546 Transcript_51844/m.121546 type:complete len:254 (+) Transcript_51844:2409-3170(+)